MWRIYYSDGSVVEGTTAEQWSAAPDTGVQVVVRFPRQAPIRWTYEDADGCWCVVYDRDLWTGDDTYDPFGWGVKDGTLIEWADYIAIWRVACAASHT